MFEKLESLEKRCIELEKLLSDSSIIADKNLYQKYAKEHSGISRLVNKYRDHRKISKEISEIEKLLKERSQEEEFIELVQEELAVLRGKIAQRKKEIEELLTEEDSDKKNNIIVEIRAGTGGAEASLFVADLYRMYSKYSNEMGWKIDVMNTHPTEAGGFKEVIFSLSGDDVYRKFKYESGTHRVQRVPVTEASGRIHTSTVTVAVLPEAEDIEIQIETKDLKIDVYRSSGPGGQSVNTADSAVRITHLPTGTVVTCQDERSQLKNKIKAMRVLRARLLDNFKREQQSKISKDRKLQIGTGERSEKIRTYNFPDRRVTDHRIGLTLYNLNEILEGALDEIISGLIEADKKMKLAQAK